MTPLEQAIEDEARWLNFYDEFESGGYVLTNQKNLRLLLDAATLVANFVKAASEPTINPENLSTAKGID